MAHQELREALTFDDVLLLPQSSDILPANCDVSTSLTPKTICISDGLPPEP